MAARPRIPDPRRRPRRPALSDECGEELKHFGEAARIDFEGGMVLWVE